MEAFKVVDDAKLNVQSFVNSSKRHFWFVQIIAKKLVMSIVLKVNSVKIAIPRQKRFESHQLSGMNTKFPKICPMKKKALKTMDI